MFETAAHFYAIFMEDCLPYLHTFWAYFPYIFCTYVVVTLLPKSLSKIKAFADADYEANRGKYHRCYAPDSCCHERRAALPKQKARKAVTRVYPKRDNSISIEHTAPQPVPEQTQIKRQVPAESIQTNTHVNQIAKMFENGNALTVTVAPVLLGKKINRVTPTIMCQDTTERNPPLTPARRQRTRTQQDVLESCLRLQQQSKDSAGLETEATDPQWAPPRRTRAAPNSLSFAGTSTTPSTASPAASPPLSASPQSSSPLPSPVTLRAPLNMKSSLEDIFAAIARQAEQSESYKFAGCKTLSPVTSIDDILSQRRLSRPLSAYSISDLLNEENSHVDESCLENLLCAVNKT